MPIQYAALPRSSITVNAGNTCGPFEWWRHSVGQGAVNSLPLPDRIVQGVRSLKPRMIRVFLQEYFDVYPDHGVFNWNKLDTYMDSFARTGAKVLASINLKPPVLFPHVNQDLWRPNDTAEWQTLIYQLVRRYSVERPIVTHWEHVNEPDIGEYGACPYRIPSIEDLHEFYEMNLQPILEAFPAAKVGGPCPADYPMALAFIDRCIQSHTRLDFVSYHRYDNNIETHCRVAETLAAKLALYPGARPELMLDEWNKDFEPPWSTPGYDAVSVEEMAMQPRRAAFTAKMILAMMDTPLTWSFYFLLWDNCMYPNEFTSFFSPEGAKAIMYKHWNEAPHRFGWYSESAKLRPQYFVYQILSRMGDEKLEVSNPCPDLTAAATLDGRKLSVLLVNFDPQASHDRVVKLRFRNLKEGAYHLKAYRIDERCAWSEEDMELLPCEARTVSVMPEFEYQFYTPADSVLWVTLEP